MSTDKFVVENLMCEGCKTNLLEGLSGIEDILYTKVDLETKEVAITHEDSISRSDILKKLDELGFPEKTNIGIDQLVKKVGNWWKN